MPTMSGRITGSAAVLAVLFGLTSAATASAQPLAAGMGEYRFGMTRQQVQQVGACHPYRVVVGTKGLECPNFRAGGRTVNISFIFAGEALDRIQLWFYEGTSAAAARDATADMLAFLADRGPLRSHDVPADRPLTAAALLSALHTKGRANENARVQVLTRPTASAPFVHGSVTRYGGTYYVFLFFAAKSSDGSGN